MTSDNAKDNAKSAAQAPLFFFIDVFRVQIIMDNIFKITEWVIISGGSRLTLE